MAKQVKDPETNMPLVTIVIPSFNHESYIEDCVKSVCNQSYSPLQVIVIDDGSSDGSPEILSNLKASYDFELIVQKNMGLATTLNTALSLAKGEYFCMMGSDDIMLPNKTATQLDYMRRNNDVAVCGGNVEYIDEEGIRLPRHEKKLAERKLDFEDLFTNKKPAIAAPTSMFMTSILKDLNGFDASSRLEDFPLWLKMTNTGYKMGAVSDVVLQYRKHNSNTSKNIRLMTESVLDAYSPYSDHSAYTMVTQKFIASMMLKAAKSDPSLALELLLKLQPKHYSSKVPRTIFRLLLTTIKTYYKKLKGSS
jgi:alpha-1,3-rhamnosyltransferase